MVVRKLKFAIITMLEIEFIFISLKQTPEVKN